jgi:hypothetical protein
MHDGREVTEYESPGGLFAWIIEGDGYHRRLAYAGRSPLTGAYLGECRMTHWSSGIIAYQPARSIVSWRWRNARGARAWLLAGNGHRHRGHSEVTRVAPPMSRVNVLALMHWID